MKLCVQMQKSKFAKNANKGFMQKIFVIIYCITANGKYPFRDFDQVKVRVLASYLLLFRFLEKNKEIREN